MVMTLALDKRGHNEVELTYTTIVESSRCCAGTRGTHYNAELGIHLKWKLKPAIQL